MNTVAANELKAMLERDQGAILINVLSEADFEEARIPGSANIPVSRNDFVERVEDLAGGKNKPIVVYCATAECTESPTAAHKLEEAGFTDVYNFEGGMEAWLDAQQYVERPDKTP
ncbi:MAG: rhodanese-like domain-containing protein [Gammaproteobacteria bacterium]|jgi:rhodanese-related sulfurtransferase